MSLDDAPFSGHLQPGERPALLIVDMVQAYLDPSSPLFADSAAHALDVTKKLVAAARSAGAPVVFTGVTYKPDGSDGGHFFRKVPALQAFVEGSPLARFPDDLQPSPGDVVITKQYPSAFFDTGLADDLRERGVDTVIVTGFSTSGCVRASALDALQYGFIPFVVSDGCADTRPSAHEANLEDLQAKYAEVIDSMEAMTMLAVIASAKADSTSSA
ncbi:isochorismatase family protein [Novosphingobium sp. ZN18A2]|uniref:isochorismatase family protein n=1 Tax=Novosphingobium sp. ZN18A2 TaxID=3079861 RepID=UPI0030CAA958